MSIQSIAGILEHVRTAGSLARKAQDDRESVARKYKSDGSVLTATDRRLDEYLFDAVSGLFPEANVITEEEKRPFDRHKAHTFAVDPIDGTDSFSQGMAGWAISVGLLDHDMCPVAGIVYAPSLDLLFFADIGASPSCNGSDIHVSAGKDALSPVSSIMISSRVHQEVDISRYPGKFRGMGSAALHLCFPLIYPVVAGAIQQSKTHIWDIAAAHAISRAAGLQVEYLDGKPIDYAALADGRRAAGVIVSGPDRVIEQLRTILINSP